MDEFYILKEAAESLWKDLRKIFTFSIFSRSICYIFSQSMTCQFGQQMTLLSSLETCHELVIPPCNFSLNMRGRVKRAISWIGFVLCLSYQCPLAIIKTNWVGRIFGSV